MKNKTLVITTIILMLLTISLFAYLNTLEGDGSQAQTFTFSTSTPTTDLVGSGWWDVLPTSISVEAMPAPTATPTKKKP